MILYGEFVAKNETKAKMEIPQNLQNPATININVKFSEKNISNNAFIIDCTVDLSFKTN